MIDPMQALVTMAVDKTTSSLLMPTSTPTSVAPIVSSPVLAPEGEEMLLGMETDIE